MAYDMISMGLWGVFTHQPSVDAQKTNKSFHFRKAFGVRAVMVMVKMGMMMLGVCFLRLAGAWQADTRSPDVKPFIFAFLQLLSFMFFDFGEGDGDAGENE